MTETLPEKLSFEESLARLEQVVRDLEEGRLGLDEGLARYQEGVGLIKSCYAQLQQVEQRIFQLVGSNEDGQLTLQPFQHEATVIPRSSPGRRPIS
jgi:exodeoxyribonuclease VII small subunit